MKYFTKDWYDLWEKTYYKFLVEEDKRAEAFSEEYFQELYKIRLKGFIVAYRKAISRLMEVGVLDGDDSDLDSIDIKKLERKFNNITVSKQERIKEILPESILREIADIRVFVLGKASRDVVKALNKFCKENKKVLDRVAKKYEKQYNRLKKSLCKDMFNNKRFCNRAIQSIEHREDSLIISFNDEIEFIDANKLVFKNYSIIKQEGPMENSCWLQDEIYKVDDKYELHILVKSHDELLEFTISAESITFVCNVNNQENY